MVYDAIIIGAGACGLMCGVQAASFGKKILVLEKNDRAGAKILISGGGRCNYTNLHSTSENFISEDPVFCEEAFKQWTVKDSIDFFESNGIIGKEKVLGQLFPVSNNAKDVVSVFLNLLRKYKAELRLNCSVIGVIKTEDQLFETIYEIDAKKVKVLSKSVVMASGGLPVSKLGASDFALRIARSFDLKIVNTAPALVPLTITGKDKEWFAALAGNSIFCKVSNSRISFRENILFTHWGLSGPAILQISSYWHAGEEITIDLLPGSSMAEIISQERNLGGKRLLQHILQEHFTKKFVESLAKFLPIDKKIASLSKVEAKLINKTIHHFIVKPAGDKGYDKAEVMRGGLATEELNSKSLESIKIPGLFFGGECVDVTGWLGGYNFQWAWASAFVIAKNL